MSEIFENGNKTIGLLSLILPHQQKMLEQLFFSNCEQGFSPETKKMDILSAKHYKLSPRVGSLGIWKNYELAAEKTHLRVMRDDLDIDKTLTKLQQTWQKHCIEGFHRFYFMKFLFSASIKSISLLLKRQSKQIDNNQHIYYSILNVINAREICLKQLRKKVNQLTHGDFEQYFQVGKKRLQNKMQEQHIQKYQIQGYKVSYVRDSALEELKNKTKIEQFAQTFAHLTKLTLYSIQIIMKWKEYIYSLSQDPKTRKQRIQYFYNDQNYLLKILNDNAFMRVSLLSDYYQFAPMNDPFLLNCVMTIQNKTVQRQEDLLLRQVFLNSGDVFNQIICKMDILAKQYQQNLKAMKNSYVSVNKKIDIIKRNKNMIQLYPLPSVVSDKWDNGLQRRAKSFKVLSSNAIRKQNDKIVVQFTNKKIGRNNSLPLPVAKQKVLLPREQSGLEKQRPPILQQILNDKLVGMLKEEVIGRIREQIKNPQMNDKDKKMSFSQKNFNKNKALQLLIDVNLHETMNKFLSNQEQKKMKKQKFEMEFQTNELSENEISSFINKIFTNQEKLYRQVQINCQQLLKTIQKSVFIYIISAKINNEVVADFICTFDEQLENYGKVVQILYIGTYSSFQQYLFKQEEFVRRQRSLIQTNQEKLQGNEQNYQQFAQKLDILIQKFINFMEKYESAIQTVVNFIIPAKNQKINKFIVILREQLEKIAICGFKQSYSKYSQMKVIYKRKRANVNDISNVNPKSLKFSVSGLLSQKKLCLQNQNNPNKSKQYLCYDIILVEILKKHISSEDFLILKQRIQWPERLRIILQTIIQNEYQDFVQVLSLEAQNITSLNSLLSQNNCKFFQVSDTKQNLLKYIKVNLTFSLPFPMKSVSMQNGNQYFRYSINQKVQYLAGTKTDFYLFETKENQNLCFVFFKVKEYLNKSNCQHLAVYIRKSLDKTEKVLTQIENLWIPMFRHPKKFTKRQDIFEASFRTQDFEAIQKDLIIGESSSFFFDMKMKNGIKYEVKKLDILFEKPFGIALLSKDNKNIFYAKIVDQ